MKDLASRLREVVRRERAADATVPAETPLGARELSYIPDPDPADPRAGLADLLGGTPLDSSGACVTVPV